MDHEDTRMNERWAPASREASRTDDIRADIRQTRADLDETVGAIEEKLSPSRAASRTVERGRQAAAGAFEQASERMQQMVPEPAARAGSTLVERIRSNPVPATMAAVSLAWLAFGGRHGDGAQLRGAGERVQGMAGEAASSASAAARQAQHTAGETASQASRRARHFTREQPLAAAGLAAAAGLVVGLALPETERENEWMGESRDAMLQRAKDTAQSAVQRAEDAAQDVTQHVKRVATDTIAGGDPSTRE